MNTNYFPRIGKIDYTGNCGKIENYSINGGRYSSIKNHGKHNLSGGFDYLHNSFLKICVGFGKNRRMISVNESQYNDIFTKVRDSWYVAKRMMCVHSFLLMTFFASIMCLLGIPSDTEFASASSVSWIQPILNTQHAGIHFNDMSKLKIDYNSALDLEKQSKFPNSLDYNYEDNSAGNQIMNSSLMTDYFEYSNDAYGIKSIIYPKNYEVIDYVGDNNLISPIDENGWYQDENQLVPILDIVSPIRTGPDNLRDYLSIFYLPIGSGFGYPPFYTMDMTRDTIDSTVKNLLMTDPTMQVINKDNVKTANGAAAYKVTYLTDDYSSSPPINLERTLYAIPNDDGILLVMYTIETSQKSHYIDTFEGILQSLDIGQMTSSDSSYSDSQNDFFMNDDRLYHDDGQDFRTDKQYSIRIGELDDGYNSYGPGFSDDGTSSYGDSYDPGFSDDDSHNLYTSTKYLDLDPTGPTSDNVDVIIVVNPDTSFQASKYVKAAEEAIAKWSALLKQRSNNYDAWNFNIMTQVGYLDTINFTNPNTILVELTGNPSSYNYCDLYLGITQPLSDPTNSPYVSTILTSCSENGQIIDVPEDDVYSTVLHEFAHSLGLGHAFNINNDLMCSVESTYYGEDYPTCEYYETTGRIDPSIYDVDALLLKYGVDGFGGINKEIEDIGSVRYIVELRT
jgi:hypothetical protein